MGRKGLKMGNKKSVVAFGIGAYNAGVHTRIQNVLGGAKIQDEAAALLSYVGEHPAETIGPCAVGYWFWGKPWRGNL